MGGGERFHTPTLCESWDLEGKMSWEVAVRKGNGKVKRVKSLGVLVFYGGSGHSHCRVGLLSSDQAIGSLPLLP